MVRAPSSALLTSRPLRIRSCPATVCHSPVTSPTWFEKRYTEILEEDATK